MSELYGQKGKHPAMSHGPSHLRNEYRAESTGDDRITKESIMQVPDSQVIVPESQYDQLSDTFENGRGLDAKADLEQLMNDKDAAFLERNRFTKNTTTVASFSDIKLLCKPDETAEVVSSFAWSAPMALPKPVPHNVTASAPLESSLPTFSQELIKANQSGGRFHCLIDDQGLPLSQDPLVPPELDVDAASYGTPAAVGKKLKKGRKPKSHHPREPTAWPPKSRNTAEQDLAPSGPYNDITLVPSIQPQRSKTSLQDIQPEAFLVESMSAALDPPIKGMQPEDEPADYKADGKDQVGIQEHGVSTNLTPEEPVKEDYLAYEDREGEVAQHRQQQSSCPAFTRPEDNQSARNDEVLEAPRYGDTPRIDSQPENCDAMLHEPSARDGIVRISKPRAKRRAKEPPAPQTPTIGGYEKVSPEHEALLSILATCLRAGDAKARDIIDANTKAHGATIASLQETISHQSNFIENLRSENHNLHSRLQRLSESTNRLQKFMKGMEGDYARLKGETESHHKTCNEIVKDKVQEVEQEKLAMRKELLKTIDTLSTSQRHMKAVMDECFSRLVVTESKHEALKSELENQTSLYDQEKLRRSDLEQQILPVIQNIQASLKDDHAALVEKLSILQGSLKDTTGESERDAYLKECSAALRNLEAIPMLPAKDLRKAEGMLRFVHESIESKFNGLTKSVEQIDLPTHELQHYIQQQFSTLRADVMKFDEAFVEYRNAQHTIDDLHQQLELQKEQYMNLEGSVRSSRQEEADLKSRYSQLEVELEEWKSKSCGHGSDPLKLEQEIANLRQQVKKAREDLREGLTELGRVQQRSEDQTIELAKVKEIMREEEADFEAEIDHVRRERDGRDEALRDLQNEKHTLASEFQLAKGEIQNLTSEMETLREANIESKKELVEARLANTQVASRSSEFALAKQHLAQQVEALHSKEQGFNDLQQENADMKAKIAEIVQEKDKLQMRLDAEESKISVLREKIDKGNKTNEKMSSSWRQLQSNADTLQNEKEQLQLQLVVSQSTLSTWKKELDNRDTTIQKNADALEGLKRQTDELQKEKRELEVSLKRSRDNEAKMVDTQAVHSSEKESLEVEVAKLRESLNTKDKELQRSQSDAAGQSKIAADRHALEIEQLNRRVSQAQNIAEKKSHEIEAHKKTMDEKYEMLLHEFRGKQIASMQSVALQSQSSQLSTESNSRTSQTLDVKGGKMRKKPNRHNTLVLDVAEASHGQSKPLPLQRNGFDDQGEDDHVLGPFDPQVDDAQGNKGSSTSLIDNFTQGMSQTTEHDKETASSSALSDPPSSDSIIDMSPLDNGTTALRSGDVRKRSVLEGGPRRSHQDGTLKNPTHAFLHESFSLSQSRPKSQANTSSRMLLPQASLAASGSDQSFRTSSNRPQPLYGRYDGQTTERREKAISPDHIGRSRLRHKTHDHCDDTALDVSGGSQLSDSSQPMGQRSVLKRKNSEEVLNNELVNNVLLRAYLCPPRAKCNTRQDLGEVAQDLVQLFDLLDLRLCGVEG
ncbi:hypothetical protein N0V90_004527 [Kalmusia sp. IMI 367209]|nr:hypothetical protein N0V90_004527 [Kalmusia sp. IMI 367209]